MFAFVLGFIWAFAEGGHAAEGGGWFEKAEPYLNYPGFEAWRFINLAIFVLIMFLLLRKPLSGAFKAKREAIRADLIKAEAERKTAASRLADAETRISAIEEEKAAIIEGARAEAEAETKRMEAEADNDMRRIREQAGTELSRKTAQVTARLRRYSAEESIRLAEEKIRNSMDTAKDAELIKANIASIGGLSR